MKYEITLTRPAYEYAEVEIEAETIGEAEAEALRRAEDLNWQGGDRLPDDAPRIIAAVPAEDQEDLQ